MKSVEHTEVMLLMSLNRQCPDCRRALNGITEQGALMLLHRVVTSALTGRKSRTALNNAIAIYQSAAKRANAKGTK